MNVKKIILISSAALVLTVIIVIFGWGGKRPAVIPAEPDPAALLEDFNYAFKMAVLACHIQDNVDLEKEIGRAQKAWNGLLLSGKGLKEFAATKDPESRMPEISAQISNALELAWQNRHEESCQKIKMAQQAYRKIKEENGRPDISIQLLDFYNDVLAASDKDTKKEIASILPGLKYKFTGLKQFQFDDRYLGLIGNMENQIADLDRLLDGPDFRRAQSELMEVFMELYINY